MKPRTSNYHNDTWPCHLYVRVGGDAASAVAWASRALDASCEDGSPCSGCVWSSAEKDKYAVWFPRKPAASTVAHESLHVVALVMDRCGMEAMSPDNSEAYCYLLSWVVSAIEGAVR
jgi:hypothetical protein